MANITVDEVRRLVGSPLDDEQARALADWYTAVARAVSDFPNVKVVEPPLRSTPR